jgi:muramoyltetrapeptide carboxypeptidase LdcA involved in peptidoglycan recycling
MEFTVPPALSRGDRVAVVAPCATPDGQKAPDHVRERGLRRLRERFGLDPVVYDSVHRERADRFANPEARAAELETAFRNPDIGAVIAVLGGNDQVRILKHLDPAVFREHPTRFFGTSDNTSFCSFLHAQGVVSFYGGTLYTDVAHPGPLDSFVAEYLERAFFDDALGVLDPPERFTDEDLDWHDPANLGREPTYEPASVTWAGGDQPARGRLWGGCLEVLDTLLAVNRVPDVEGGVLLLETSEELIPTGEVFRVLTAMGERGLLDGFEAVLVGRAKARNVVEDPGPEGRERYRATQREAIETALAEYAPDVPVVFDLPVGHTKPTAPLPIGGEVRVDPAAERIEFL